MILSIISMRESISVSFALKNKLTLKDQFQGEFVLVLNIFF